MRKIVLALVVIIILAVGCVTVVTPPASPSPAEKPSTPSQTDTVSPAPAQVTTPSFNLPEVAIFNVVPANIVSGDYATLTWDVRNGYDVEIEPGFTIIRPQGSQPVNPPFTTTYRLTATNNQGSIVATTTLTVSGVPPTIDTPVIKSFTATPNVIRSGGSSILSWQTINGSSVSIDKNVGTVSGEGSTQVLPTATTTYMLTVTSPEGAQFQTVTVNVK
ncbi:MAG: hypothetical protein PHU70_03290 [Dehalococcoidia bacterium]|nr:hypothetical protein [Dehalococcoidia bacterium]